MRGLTVPETPARTGATEIPGVAAVARRPHESAPRIADTIGLVERASGPRNIPTVWAIALILGLSAVAGSVTWLVRAQAGASATQAKP